MFCVLFMFGGGGVIILVLKKTAVCFIKCHIDFLFFSIHNLGLAKNNNDTKKIYISKLK